MRVLEKLVPTSFKLWNENRQFKHAFRAAHCVFGLLEHELQSGRYSQFAYFIRRRFGSGTKLQQVKMVSYPTHTGLKAGVEYAHSMLPSYDYWAFGLIIGPKGSNENLQIIVICGGQELDKYIRISRPVSVDNGSGLFSGPDVLTRLDAALEIIPTPSEQLQTLALMFSRAS
jgi:ribulose bisphosphate carboxylase small subunit